MKSSRPLFLVIVAAMAICLAGHAFAGIWLGSFNVLRLGQNWPSGADQVNKRNEIRQVCQTNHVTLLQEVMKTSEVGMVTPGGWYSKVSGVKGPTSYKEAYGFVYHSSVSVYGNIVDLPSTTTYDREPSAVIAWTGGRWAWLVNYHAAFSATPNRREIEALDTVYNFFRTYYGNHATVIGGDFNRVATSSYFNNLKNAGATQIQPDVATTINTSGQWASRYDHFAWNPNTISVSNTGRDTISNLLYWRNNVSDHAPIYCYIH